MAARARDELTKELARFWRDRVRTNGDIPWSTSRIGEFARFVVELRIVLLNEGSAELTVPELNMAQARLLPRFTDFLIVADAVQEVLELEAATGILRRVDRPRVQADVDGNPLVRTPREVGGDYTRGKEGRDPAGWER